MAQQSVGNIELRHVLGQGGFGKVFLGYDKKARKEVAVKVIDKQTVKEHNLQAYVEREIEMMRKIKHEHVVKLLSALDTAKAYYLILELAPGGELFDKIVESKRFDEDTARTYFQQLISAVLYCHENNIVHRDLKAENLLLGAAAELKVCDFGLSRYAKKTFFTDSQVMFMSLAGSTDYQAPEVIKEGGYKGFSCDIWSCGVILFFMLCGYLPFADRNEELTRKRVLECNYNRNAKYLSESAKDLISHLLVLDPDHRYSAQQVVQHPWFRVNLDAAKLFPQISGIECVMSPLSTPTTFEGGSKQFVTRAETPTHPSPVSDPKAELHLAFQSCNINHSGFLTREEVRDVLIKLNNEEPVSDEEVSSFMSNFELTANGRITEEQFIIGWTKNSKMAQQYQLNKLVNIFHFDLERELLDELRKAFETLDSDHSGVITPQDLMRLENLDLTAEQAQELIHAMDVEHRGKAGMNFEHFVFCCTKYNLLQKHPLMVRLKRLNELFDVADIQDYRSFLTTGFTVAGMREVIANKIKTEADSAQTLLKPGEMEGYYYGEYQPEGKKILEVGIMLVPAADGYTKVHTYRIFGKTETFHDWFRMFRRMLREEILQCEEDTMICGEPELM